MKKLFTILWTLLSFCVGMSVVFADEIPVIINPSQQNAISWSILTFDVSTSGNVTQNSKIQITLPDNLKYLSASIPPRNLLQIPLGEQPYWLVSAGDSFNIQLTVKQIAQEFSEANFLVQFINWDEWIATWVVSPIADIQVKKTITSPNPKKTWDTVSFDIVIKNIGSVSASNVKVVDIWPSNVLSFANFWTLNWNQIVPYIYNWVSNQYEFTIWDMWPGEEAVLSVWWTMNTQKPVGTAIVNTAFAVFWWDQLSTWNDRYTVTGYVSWYPNLYVTAQKTSQNPTSNGDPMRYSVTFGNDGQEVLNTGKLIVYLPEIMNLNNVSASLEWATQELNRLSRDLSRLQAWTQRVLTISWEMMTSSPVWTEFTFRAVVSTDEEELTWSDNESVLTWIIQRFFAWELSATVQNMTRPNMNVNDTKIQGISWDEAQIRITLTNNGNVNQTWLLRVTYAGDIWYFQEVSLTPWKSTVFTASKIIWPKWFVSMTPEIKFTYGDGLSLSKSITIDEPLQCGDWFVTQNEVCDTASDEWLLTGQECSSNCMNIITNSILNTACIEYTSERWDWQVCDDAIIHISDSDYACKSITSTWTVIPVDDNGNWSMKFSCTAAKSHSTIVIDCGNWRRSTWYDKKEYSYLCSYNNLQEWTVLNVSCIVDDDDPENPNPACTKDVIAGVYPVPNCWNGIIEPGEECDLWNTTTRIWKPKEIWDYLDYFNTVDAWRFANGGYSCKNCKILSWWNWGFVYEPAKCMQTDTPISVMNNEIIPFWRRIWITNTQSTTDNNNWCRNWNDANITLLNENTMYCRFSVYNGNSYKQSDSNPAFRFRTWCINNNFNNGTIYEYFKPTHQTQASWASISTVNAITDGISEEEFWEYKLVLDEVEYEYCDITTHDWVKWERFGLVCEVDFAVTKPYTMQISTLWVNPIATSASFLEDFRAMEWIKLLNKTDLSDVINTDNSSYDVTTNAQEKIDEFKNKYEKLAVEVKPEFKVNGRTIEQMFGSNVTVMKVPNQHIYFIKWKNGNDTLKLSQDNLLANSKWITSAYTIFVDWMDVEIKWDVLQYAMIITTKHMRFKDKLEGTETRCNTWWQVLQWLFVALEWFEAGEPLRNTSKNERRCAWWWLRVKWVLIWDWLEDLMNSKRSQLNEWFTSDPDEKALKRKRREIIIWWASVLIEYNPSLWKTLPPWAEIFTESLDVYRK